MSYNVLPGFQPVTFKSEREAALKNLAETLPLLSAVAANNATFIFKITQVVGTKIYLTTLEKSREANTGEELKFIFTLSTGQYAALGHLELATGASSVAFDFANVNLMRLQRRDSFRINVPPSVSLQFYVDSKIRPENALRVTDVSMGGLAINLPADKISNYSVGKPIKGSLVLLGREPIELEGHIRHHFPKESDRLQKVGVQLSQVTIEQQRELLSLTLHLHREINHRV